jgi:hypothetical protein
LGFRLRKHLSNAFRKLAILSRTPSSALTSSADHPLAGITT